MSELRPIQANQEAAAALAAAGITNYEVRSEAIGHLGPPMILTRVTVTGGGEMAAAMQVLRSLPGVQDSCYWQDEVRVYRARGRRS